MSEDVSSTSNLKSGWYNRTTQSWKYFRDVWSNLMCMGLKIQLPPGFEIAHCCTMKYLIRCQRWVSMKETWKEKDSGEMVAKRTGHTSSVIPPSSYSPTLKCDIPTFWTKLPLPLGRVLVVWQNQNLAGGLNLCLLYMGMRLGSACTINFPQSFFHVSNCVLIPPSHSQLANNMNSFTSNVCGYSARIFFDCQSPVFIDTVIICHCQPKEGQ